MHDEGLQEWENALIAQFLGKIPIFGVFWKSSNLLWGKDVDLRSASKNLFVNQFLSVEARDRILEKGLWHIQGQSLIVRKWTANMENLEMSWKQLSVWVHLKGISLELFTRRGIGYITSVLGVPFYMDKFTTEKRKLEYAIVCIEVKIDKPFPRFIEVVRGNGGLAEVEVIVPWMPIKCSKCKNLGHLPKT